MVRRNIVLELVFTAIVIIALQIVSALTLTWVTVEVSTTGNTGQAGALDRVDANTFVACFFDTTNNDLMFSKTITGGSEGSWITSIVDASVNGQGQCDIAVIDSDEYVIAYSTNVVNRDIKVANTANGGTSWTLFTVESAGDVGSRPSIQAISSTSWLLTYYDQTDGNPRSAVTADTGATYTFDDITAPGTFCLPGGVGKEDSLTFFIICGGAAAGGPPDIVAFVTTDGGVSWSAGGTLDANIGTGAAYGVTRTAGSWYACVIDNNATPDQLQVYRSTTQGASWTQAIIEGSDNIGLTCAMRPETDSRILMNYHKTVSAIFSPMFAQSDDSGVTWETSQISGIASANFNTVGHNIGVRGSANYLVFEYRLSSGDAIVYRSALGSAPPTLPTGDPIELVRDNFADSFGITQETAGWIFGIGASGIIIFAFIRKGGTSPIVVSFAILLSVGLGVLLDFFPVWLLFMVVFIVIAVAGIRFFGSGKGDGDSE